MEVVLGRFLCLFLAVFPAALCDGKSLCPHTSNRKLLRRLAPYRVRLQNFTPLPLCARSVKGKKQQLTNNTSSYNSNNINGVMTQSHISVEDWSKNLGMDLSSVTGCTAEDLKLILPAPPADNTLCKWELYCQPDSARYPAILYNARLAFPPYLVIVCDCTPIQRQVPVLRQRWVNGCEVWDSSIDLETVTVAYSCSS